MKRRGLAALALAELLACAPYPTWVGRSPDRSVTAAIVQRAGDQKLTVGRAERRHEYVAPGSVVLHDSGRFAYAARDAGRWRVYFGAGRSGAYDGIGQIILDATGREMAFAGEREDVGWFVVTPSRSFGPYLALGPESLRYGPRGQLIFIAQDAQGWAVSVQGRLGPRFEAVRSLRVGERQGRLRLAYVGRRGQRLHVVIDEKVGPGFDWHQELVMDERGHVAHVSGSLDEMSLFVEGQRRLKGFASLTDLRFAGGVAAVVVEVEPGLDRVWVAGRWGPPFERILDRSLVLSPDGEVAYVGRRGDEVYAVVGSISNGPFREVRDLRWAGRFGFLGVDEDSTEVVVGSVRREVSGRPRDLRFDARRFGYVTTSSSGDRVVTDRGVSSIYSEIHLSGLALGPRSGQFVHLAREGEAWLVVDEAGQKTPFDVAALLSRYLYLGRIPSNRQANIDLERALQAEADRWTR